MIWAADAGGGSFVDPVMWVQWGVLGLVALGFATDRLHGRGALEREERARDLAVSKAEAERDRLIIERDECRAQRDSMAELFQNKALPVLGEFLAVTKALLPALQDVARAQPQRRTVRHEDERDPERGDQW